MKFSEQQMEAMGDQKDFEDPTGRNRTAEIVGQSVPNWPQWNRRTPEWLKDVFMTISTIKKPKNAEKKKKKKKKKKKRKGKKGQVTNKHNGRNSLISVFNFLQNLKQNLSLN